MAGRLQDKVAVVTGGTRGIGLATAQAFLDEGARVAITGRSQEKGDAALKELDGGDRVFFIAADVTLQADCERTIDDTVAHFGGLDILVNNAGGATQIAPIFQMTDEAWQHALNWNLNSVFYHSRRALPHMMEKQWGRIINLSSLEGKIGKPGVVGYVTAKHGLHGFTKCLANEVGTLGITANCICPGLVLTDIVAEAFPAFAAAGGFGSADDLIEVFLQDSATKKPCTVEQMAATAVFLASEDAASLTGQAISVDGGSAPY
jgi:3-hydroxybutyrate dehydrogenase